MKLFDYLIKNPTITKNCEDITFAEYVESKDINTIEVVVTQDSPLFKINRNLDFTSITIEGCLLKNPVCGLPKIGFLQKFYLMKEHVFSLTIEASPEIDKEEEERFENIFTLNKKYNTRYISKRNKDLNIGSFWPYNSINIYNSDKEYLKFFYDSVSTSKEEICIYITFQKIKEWKIFYPIIGLKIIGGGHEIKTNIIKSVSNWFHEQQEGDNVLKIDKNLDMEDEIDIGGFKVKKRK
jgi:hypothetical protein